MIVPVVAVPPATPFTSHVTAVLDVLVTLAANCCGPPAATNTEVGETETETPLPVVDVFSPPPHPESSVASRTETAA